MVGGSLPWGNPISVTYSHSQLSQYNTAYPNGPSLFEIGRGDWFYSLITPYTSIMNQNRQGLGYSLWNGESEAWSTLSNSEKSSLTWIWVDHRVNSNNNLQAGISPLIIFNGHRFVGIGRYDTRDGREMELYKREPNSGSPPSGSGGGSHYWDTVVNTWRQQSQLPW